MICSFAMKIRFLNRPRQNAFHRRIRFLNRPRHNAFHSIAAEEKWGVGGLGSGTWADKRNQRWKEKSGATLIDMDSFVKAVLRNERLDFPGFATAYDQEDTTGCFEGIFAESVTCTQQGEKRKSESEADTATKEL